MARSLSLSLSQQYLTALAVCVLVVTVSRLSSRYYTSAAFERPLHFSCVVLLLSGLALAAAARLHRAPQLKIRSHVHRAPDTAAPWLPRLLRILRNPRLLVAQLRRSSSFPPTFVVLPFCIVCRTLLYWSVVCTVHCSWDGLHAFLPFLLALLDSFDLRSAHLPRHEYDPSTRTFLSKLATFAFVWALAVTDTFLLAETNTGVICPAGWSAERLIPLAQVLLVALDAVLIHHTARLRGRSEQDLEVSALLGLSCLVSAGIVATLLVCLAFNPVLYRWNFKLVWLDVHDLTLDGATAAAAVLSGIYLLGYLQALTISLLATGASVFVSIQADVVDGIMAEVWSSLWGLTIGVVVFLGFGLLLHVHSPGPVSRPAGSWDNAFWKSRFLGSAAVVFALIYWETMLYGTPIPSAPTFVISDARRESDAWIAAAARSTTLNSAVEEYRSRYGLPPPPNFDKWYNFAIGAQSPVMDTFDQINSDLLPFWGLSPSALRQRTTHLLEHPILSMGGLIIEGGQVDISPHVHGTHRWMMDIIKDMVEPFAQWLPDMQLAFNLDDECRVSVPFELTSAYTDEAIRARAQTNENPALLPFSESQEPRWNTAYLDADDTIWSQGSPWFQQWSRSPIFYQWISTTCPADSAAKSYRWWNRKASCRGCAEPHTTDGWVSNWTLAGDLCHQPDIAYLHGFMAAPSAVAPSQALFPVFSQSRTHNFADILYPSPWNFGDKVIHEPEQDLPWGKKLNSAFWRGASSDGFATSGSWQMFLRARFVHMSTQIGTMARPGNLLRFLPRLPNSGPRNDGATGPATVVPGVGEANQGQVNLNVSFVGQFSRCDEPDCVAEHTTFYGSPNADPPPSIGFQESWRHRHLVDLDGAAFSGRFLPFLLSNSLPYRAALFRTWWEERVHAWRHFVPLDLRLREFPSVLDYLSGAGSAEAEEMANAGREWAAKALRKEDMQVYMFRLLLEWGRLVDDRRLEVGFSL
ncbi:glycosyltransferase family 90 protein [Xylariomycetidae sp. FL0641]|nr:glycosyltransferase family 90 protein [Xylariomycetidae sp. FL0641]